MTPRAASRGRGGPPRTPRVVRRLRWWVLGRLGVVSPSEVYRAQMARELRVAREQMDAMLPVVVRSMPTPDDANS